MSTNSKEVTEILVSTNSKKASEILERLLAIPAMSEELNQRLARAEAVFRKQGITETDMPAHLKQTVVSFIKRFLKELEADDEQDNKSVQDSNKQGLKNK